MALQEVFYSIGAVGVGCGVTEEVFYSIGAVITEEVFYSIVRVWYTEEVFYSIVGELDSV